VWTSLRDFKHDSLSLQQNSKAQITQYQQTQRQIGERLNKMQVELKQEHMSRVREESRRA